MKNKIKVLSLFDGIAGARQALKELAIDCEYHASEIDKFAIKIAKANHHDIVHLGNVKEIFASVGFDLLIGGSPCQDLSCAKKNRKGLEGERSGLFYEYVRILKECKPKYFILENVASMSKEAKNIITEKLFNIEPILINSSLLTAQQRKRLYWIGELQEDESYKKIEIEQPEDKNISLQDILEDGISYQDKSYTLTASYAKAVFWNTLEKKQRTMIARPIKIGHLNKGGQGDRIYSIKNKSICLNASGGGRGAKTGLYKIDLPNGDYIVRKLTVKECCRLQGFPDNYCDVVSNSQSYKALGNSFTVPIIKHILTKIFKYDK